MFDHLRYHITYVETRSPAGERAEKVLMLNDERSVEYRKFVLSVIAALEEKMWRLEETIRRIDRRLGASPERAVELTHEKTSVEADLVKLKQNLARVTGGAFAE